MGLSIVKPKLTQSTASLYKSSKAGNKTFEGFNRNPDALDSDTTWLISQTTATGSDIVIQEALQGFETATWTDRASYFAGGAFVNTISTLFNGIDQSVSFGNEFNYDIANQWAISLWVKPNNLAVRHTLYSKTTNDGNVYGWGFYLDVGGMIFIQARAPGYLRQHTGTLLLNSGVWNHVVISYAGSSNIDGFRIYINGVLGSIPATGTLGASLLSGQTAIIGRRNTAFPLSGIVNTGIIFNKSLTLTEASQLYNGGSPGDPSLLSFYPDAQSYFKFGNGDTHPFIFDNKGAKNGSMLNMSAANFVSDNP